jgi:serine phosphatase RsbU (regulator of sigma subunit)
MKIVKELGSPARIMDACQYLYETYNRTGNSDSALKYYIDYSTYKDTLYNIEKTKNINKLEKIYETEKKEQQIALQKIKIRNNKIKLWALSVILFLILGLVFQILRIIRNKKRTNNLLKQKNKLLAESNRLITSSITYASFIQAAILPPLDLFKESFPQHFILFKPKDIVSGDFYWITKVKDQTIIALADCTGHGVPGAFMSMLGITLLNEIINIQHIISTNKILDMLRKKIIDALRQKADTYDSRDGMDISVCSIDTQSKQMEFSGAYRPIVILSDRKMKLIDGDKMPIGFHKTRNSPFKKIKYNFSSGDIFYLYTDGYPDQFGGELGKKYTRQKFRNLLDSIHELPLDEQKDKLEKELIKWKGNIEQIDDITVLGIKV